MKGGHTRKASIPSAGTYTQGILGELNDDGPLVIILQSIQSTDRKGGRALRGTTGEERRGKCETKCKVAPQQRQRGLLPKDVAHPSNKASRSIIGRLSTIRSKFHPPPTLPTCAAYHGSAWGRASTVPKVPVDPLLPEHREGRDEEGTCDADVE